MKIVGDFSSEHAISRKKISADVVYSLQQDILFI